MSTDYEKTEPNLTRPVNPELYEMIAEAKLQQDEIQELMNDIGSCKIPIRMFIPAVEKLIRLVDKYIIKVGEILGGLQ